MGSAVPFRAFLAPERPDVDLAAFLQDPVGWKTKVPRIIGPKAEGVGPEFAALRVRRRHARAQRRQAGRGLCGASTRERSPPGSAPVRGTAIVLGSGPRTAVQPESAPFPRRWVASSGSADNGRSGPGGPRQGARCGRKKRSGIALPWSSGGLPLASCIPSVAKPRLLQLSNRLGASRNYMLHRSASIPGTRNRAPRSWHREVQDLSLAPAVAIPADAVLPGGKLAESSLFTTWDSILRLATSQAQNPAI